MEYKKILTIPETVAMLTLDGMNIVKATEAIKRVILYGQVTVYKIDDKYYVMYTEVLEAVKGGAA